jgi:hypothetical protein
VVSSLSTRGYSESCGAFLVVTTGVACYNLRVFRIRSLSQALPSRVLNLSSWKLQIPVTPGGSDQPEEVNWPALGRYRSRFFYVNRARSGIVLSAHIGGAIIPGSMFARTELREMTDNGTRKASWSNASTTNTMTIREAITHLPAARPAIAAGQIHDGNTYLALIRLDGTRLWVRANNRSAGILDADYRLGTIFTVKLAATNGRIQVYYNNVLKVDFPQACSACYFKAGAYLQSNISYGDNPDAYGEVIIYSLNVSHS